MTEKKIVYMKDFSLRPGPFLGPYEGPVKINKIEDYTDNYIKTVNQINDDEKEKQTKEQCKKNISTIIIMKEK